MWHARKSLPPCISQFCLCTHNLYSQANKPHHGEGSIVIRCFPRARHLALSHKTKICSQPKLLTLHALNPNLRNVTPSLISQNSSERMFFNSLALLLYFPSHILTSFDINIHQKFQIACSHASRNIIIIVVMTLCCLVMSHVTSILFYHTFMLTLQNSFMSCALWLPHKRDTAEF